MRPRIQIDMFEVQLGAGILLQFRNLRGQPVRVLADAGVHASGYPEDHVHRKLKSLESDNINRIDLLIGTHYDKDHLAGLVPIIDDPTITIGEAWLPPVADDTEAIGEDVVVRSEHLLATKFSRQAGREELVKYLARKASVCEHARQFEEAARNPGTESLPLFSHPAVHHLDPGFDDASSLEYFTRHLHEATQAAGEPEDTCHADASITRVPPRDQIVQHLRGSAFDGSTHPYYIRREFGPRVMREWQQDPELAQNHRVSFAQIRKAAAKDAINATSLNAVVLALKRRNIPIRNYIIHDGRPTRFIWDGVSRQFIPSRRGRNEGTELHLLGPSQSLVDEHAKRLPIGDYFKAAFHRRLPVKAITPSNELSYVVRFDHAGQKVLISGDAGCVDFKKSRTEFHPELIAALNELHVIQIAHHGGNNAEFYNALLASEYPEQTARSFLLLSHATADKHRPSELFAEFVAEVRTDGDDFAILFTSKPQPDRVAKFRQLVHPPVGSRGNVGDVRLRFDGKRWNVASHAVAM